MSESEPLPEVRWSPEYRRFFTVEDGKEWMWARVTSGIPMPGDTVSYVTADSVVGELKGAGNRVAAEYRRALDAETERDAALAKLVKIIIELNHYDADGMPDDRLDNIRAIVGPVDEEPTVAKIRAVRDQWRGESGVDHLAALLEIDAILDRTEDKR